ncbi:ubiquinol-cytochrome C reductase hinge protein-domain-containing protein [Ilyonectria sp. MPI-CAGE-AT-0026]|nr:ubiquinol-cytochrome C reductase hinge protein-domain-containing protein [Ilyonectria sp. MPI-CAGE-AT-0026]
MGIWDAFSDIVEAVTPWSVVEAEAPAEDKEEQPEAESKDDDEEDDEEEEDDDDDEIVDPKDVLEEECRNSAQCHGAKHHFDECVERVQQQESEDGAKEDCVEEFFHLAHCATACAAPKLWAKLK